MLVTRIVLLCRGDIPKRRSGEKEEASHYFQRIRDRRRCRALRKKMTLGAPAAPKRKPKPYPIRLFFRPSSLLHLPLLLPTIIEGNPTPSWETHPPPPSHPCPFLHLPWRDGAGTSVLLVTSLGMSTARRPPLHRRYRPFLLLLFLGWYHGGCPPPALSSVVIPVSLSRSDVKGCPSRRTLYEEKAVLPNVWMVTTVGRVMGAVEPLLVSSKRM